MAIKRAWFKKLLYVLIGGIGLLGIVAAIFIGPYGMRVELFPAEPDQGYFADFYLYISPTAIKQAQSGVPITLLIQPNNSGNSDDPEFHRKDAWWMGLGRHKIADELGVALLVPAFVRPMRDWHIYTHALDRDVFTTDRLDVRRADLQLIAMIDRVKHALSSTGLPMRDRVLIQGYSASGMFANRFTALHPDRVLAAAAGSPGGWPIAPVDSIGGVALGYPAGIADINELAGESFDTLSYRSVPQLIVMGSEDDNDSLDFGDGWDKEQVEVVDSLFGDTPIARWPAAQKLYKTAGAQTEFILVEGVGHDRRALQPYTTRFFKEILIESSSR